MNDITKKVISGMSGDGFNERKSYININNDINNLDKEVRFDQSLSKMRIDENKPNVETTSSFNQQQQLENSDTSILKRNIDMHRNMLKNKNNFR